MAIMGPADLPSIMKVRSEPMKKYVLSKLGYPTVDVELKEDQWETVWRVAGDFIAQYFPREQKLGVFWTQPLKSTYPLPKDAYWVQQVNWDPVTTRIDDVFGAESFLFCLAPNFHILDKDGKLQPLGEWKAEWKAKTPYGNRKLKIVNRVVDRDLPKVRIYYDNGVVDGTTNHVLAVPGAKWREFGEIVVGEQLQGINNAPTVHNVETYAARDAISVRALNAGCYYGCTEGEPVLIH
jgi:hypothetical protein